MKHIAENVNIFLGLNNATNPSSSLYKEGMAYVSDNSRIDKELVWNKGPSLGSVAGGPTARTIPSGSGNHFAPININGSFYIADGLGDSDTIAEGPNGYAYYTKSSDYPQYWDGTDNSGGGDSGLAAPSSITVESSGETGTRQESGIYVYICTAYNATRDVESLPAPAKEWWVGKRFVNDARQADVPQITCSSSGNTIRIYRSKVIKIHKGDVLQLGQANSPTEFYFVGEAASGTAFKDYAHDSEIAKPENLYTGRGSRPPSTGTEALAAFDNRMWYFKDGIAYWSSAGRPGEVPQSYTLTIDQTNASYSQGIWSTGDFKDQLTAQNTDDITATLYPLLDTGIYGEAKLRMPELSGETVVRAQAIGNKLWVFTAKKAGYITKTDSLEGYRFVKVRDGIGLCSPWCLAVTPMGVYGADAKGMWALDNEYPKRLSDGIIDISNSSKSTYVPSTSLSSSFLVWVDELNEVWWNFCGSDLVTNGGFTADSGWTKGDEWTISLSAANWTNSGDTTEGSIQQSVSITANTAYKLAFTLTNKSGNPFFTPTLGGTDGTTRTANASVTEAIVAGSTDSILKFSAGYNGPAGGETWRLDTVSLSPIRQLAYQADKGCFVGPYGLPILGGCSYTLGDDTECYMTGGKTPALSSRTGIQTLKFWFGQNSVVKENIDIEVLYHSITASQDITVSTYLNSVASETGAQSKTDYTHNDDNGLCNYIQPVSSGRYFEVCLSIPHACTAPIAGINYTALPMARKERGFR